MDRSELLSHMRGGREALEQALATIPSNRLEAPTLPGGWAVKDLLAHLGWWERRIANLYQILLRGDVPHPFEAAEPIDDLNARVYADHHHQPLPPVRDNERAAYEALRAVAETAPEPDLFDPYRFPQTEGEPFVNWIRSNTYDHYAQHLDDLRAAARRA